MAISSNYQTQRVTSLYSGMDTESLVKNALTGRQTKVDDAYRTKVKTEWKLEAYTEVSKSVSSFKSTYFDILGKESLLSSASYNKFTVSSSGGKGVSVSTASGATAANYKIVSAKMASSASVTASGNVRSSGDVSTLRASATGVRGLTVGGAVISGDASIGDFASAFGLGTNEDLSFSINGETFTFEQTDKISDIISEVNGSAIANVNMSLDAVTGKFTIESKTQGQTSKFTTANISGTFFSTFDKNVKATATSATGVTVNDEAITGETKISELATRFDLAEGEKLKFSVNGATFEFEQTATMNDVMNAVNASETADVTMSLDSSGKFTISRDTSGLSSSLNLGNMTGKFFSKAENTGIGIDTGIVNTELKGIGIKAGSTGAGISRSDTIAEALLKQGSPITGYANSKMKVTVNGKDFTFDINCDTISSMMSEINSDSTLGATFNYSEITDTFSVSSIATGAESKLEISGFNALFGATVDGSKTGTNAEMEIDDGSGTTYKTVQASNTFTLDGVKFEINNNFDSRVAGQEDEAVQVGVKRDVSATVDLVKKFIDSYNEMVGSLNKYYNDRVDRKYEPLTEDEEEAITEKQAEKLTNKAKEGILGSDATIGTLLSSMRSSLLVKVGDTGLSPLDLGISTVAWDSNNWEENQGKLQLDEERLTAMLEENPGVVQEVLSGVATNADGSINTETTRSADGLSSVSQSGLFTRMNSFISKFNTTMRTKLTDTAEDVTDMAEKVDDLTKKMNEYEESLWSKYSLMETMMSKLQSQTDALSALFTTN